MEERPKQELEVEVRDGRANQTAQGIDSKDTARATIDQVTI